MAKLRLFAQAREVAGTKEWSYPAATVADMLAAACDEFGVEFARLLPHCRVWVDGEQAEPEDEISDGNEVAVLPPVSGGQ
jgi:sulfur-carrier protein